MFGIIGVENHLHLIAHRARTRYAYPQNFMCGITKYAIVIVIVTSKSRSHILVSK